MRLTWMNFFSIDHTQNQVRGLLAESFKFHLNLSSISNIFIRLIFFFLSSTTRLRYFGVLKSFAILFRFIEPQQKTKSNTSCNNVVNMRKILNVHYPGCPSDTQCTLPLVSRSLSGHTHLMVIFPVSLQITISCP